MVRQVCKRRNGKEWVEAYRSSYMCLLFWKLISLQKCLNKCCTTRSLAFVKFRVIYSLFTICRQHQSRTINFYQLWRMLIHVNLCFISPTIAYDYQLSTLFWIEFVTQLLLLIMIMMHQVFFLWMGLYTGKLYWQHSMELLTDRRRRLLSDEVLFSVHSSVFHFDAKLSDHGTLSYS